MNTPPHGSPTPCPSWTNGWSPPTPESIFNTLSGSQHLSMRSPSAQRMSYQGLQTPSQSCMVGLTTSPPTHHSPLFRNSLSNGTTPGFDHPVMQSSCHAVDFEQEKNNSSGSSHHVTLTSPRTTRGFPLKPRRPASRACPRVCRPVDVGLGLEEGIWSWLSLGEMTADTLQPVSVGSASSVQR